MTANRLILATGVLAALSVARPVDAQNCCAETDAYANEVGTQACTDGTNNWTCPYLRAHYPVQRFCNSNGPMACLAKRPKFLVPVYSVRCGTFQQRCPDGLPTTGKMGANNDDCGGNCLDQSGTSSECEQSKRDQLKEQTDELERILQDAKGHRSRRPSRE